MALKEILTAAILSTYVSGTSLPVLAKSPVENTFEVKYFTPLENSRPPLTERGKITSGINLLEYKLFPWEGNSSPSFLADENSFNPLASFSDYSFLENFGESVLQSPLDPKVEGFIWFLGGLGCLGLGYFAFQSSEEKPSDEGEKKADNTFGGAMFTGMGIGMIVYGGYLMGKKTK